MFRDQFRCRLCWRITFAFFAAILVIECLILIPSYGNFERDLLARLEATGRAAVATALRGGLDLGPALAAEPGLRGAAVYTAMGALMGTFGEALRLVYAGGPVPEPRRHGGVYETAWGAARLGVPNVVVARLDAAPVDAALVAFVWRIVGLVTVISAFVTVVTMFLLGRYVLAPMLALRGNLAAASADPDHAEAHRMEVTGKGEWDDVIEAFNRLLGRNADHLRHLAENEAALQESERRYRELYENAPIAYALVRTADGTLASFNTGLGALLGYSRDELATMRVLDFYADTPHGRPKAERLLNRLRDGGSLRDAELQMTRKDGRTIWVSLTSEPVTDEAGAVVAARSVVRDITDRKWAQRQLLLTKEAAEESSRAKTHFVSGMSHELRTPMNAVIGFAELLKHTPGEPLSARQQGSVDSILVGGRHLLRLIDDSLDVSAIEAGRLAVDIEEADPGATFAECAVLIGPLADGLGVRVVDLSVDDCGLAVLADARRLKQVLLNLISNAVKYNRPSGTVWLDFGATDEGQMRLQPDLFSPFECLGAEDTAIQGSGIGLVVSQQLVELMDGSIGFESTPGRGTIFWVELPVAERTLGQPCSPRCQALARGSCVRPH